MNKRKYTDGDKYILKRLKTDKKYRKEYFEALADEPLAVQLALLRRLEGVTQKKLASKMRVKQSFLSRLESPEYDNLESQYEKMAKALNAKITIVLNDNFVLA